LTGGYGPWKHIMSVPSLVHINCSLFQPSTVSLVAVSFLWTNDVPLKVVMFAWWMFRDSMPTKDNLLRRGVIHRDARMCVTGCGSEENLAHLFYIVKYLVRYGIIFSGG